MACTSRTITRFTPNSNVAKVPNPTYKLSATNKVLANKSAAPKTQGQGGGVSSTALGWAQFGLSLISTIANVWMAMKQLDLAERQFKFSKEQFHKNFGLALDAYVRKVEDKYRTRKYILSGDQSWLDYDKHKGAVDKYTDNVPWKDEYLGREEKGGTEGEFYGGKKSSALGATLGSPGSKTFADSIKEQVGLIKKSISETGDLPDNIKQYALKTKSPSIDYASAATQLVNPSSKMMDLSAVIDNVTQIKTPEDAIETNQLIEKGQNPDVVAAVKGQKSLVNPDKRVIDPEAKQIVSSDPELKKQATEFAKQLSQTNSNEIADPDWLSQNQDQTVNQTAENNNMPDATNNNQTNFQSGFAEQQGTNSGQKNIFDNNNDTSIKQSYFAQNQQQGQQPKPGIGIGEQKQSSFISGFNQFKKQSALVGGAQPGSVGNTQSALAQPGSASQQSAFAMNTQNEANSPFLKKKKRAVTPEDRERHQSAFAALQTEDQKEPTDKEPRDGERPTKEKKKKKSALV